MADKDWIGQGMWSTNGRIISYMWRRADDPEGHIYYEDVPEVRERGLPIRPDKRKK